MNAGKMASFDPSSTSFLQHRFNYSMRIMTYFLRKWEIKVCNYINFQKNILISFLIFYFKLIQNTCAKKIYNRPEKISMR